MCNTLIPQGKLRAARARSSGAALTALMHAEMIMNEKPAKKVFCVAVSSVSVWPPDVGPVVYVRKDHVYVRYVIVKCGASAPAKPKALRG